MKTISIQEGNAIKAHQSADQSGKSLLENLLGAEVFSRDITDRVKTWEDAAAIYGIDPVNGLPFPVSEDSMQIASNNFHKAQIIRKVINEDWEPDWDDEDEEKWSAWYDMRSSAGGFSFIGCRFGCAAADVGARLVFKSEKLARYAATQFEEIFKAFMTL